MNAHQAHPICTIRADVLHWPLLAVDTSNRLACVYLYADGTSERIVASATDNRRFHETAFPSHAVQWFGLPQKFAIGLLAADVESIVRNRYTVEISTPIRVDDEWSVIPGTLYARPPIRVFMGTIPTIPNLGRLGDEATCVQLPVVGLRRALRAGKGPVTLALTGQELHGCGFPLPVRRLPDGWPGASVTVDRKFFLQAIDGMEADVVLTFGGDLDPLEISSVFTTRVAIIAPRKP